MRKLYSPYKKMFFLILMVFIGSIFMLISLTAIGNNHQVYNDVISEILSSFSGNKSAEMDLLFLLIITGIAIYGIFYMFAKRRWHNCSMSSVCEEMTSSKEANELVCGLITVAGTCMVVRNSMNQIVIASILFIVMLLVIDRKLLLTGLCTFILGIYACIGIYRLYSLAGGNKNINNTVIAMTVLVISLIPLLFRCKEKVMLRLGLIEKILVPLCLLIYLTDKYKTDTGITTIAVPTAIKVIILLIISSFMLEAFYTLSKWSKIIAIDDLIGFGTCVSIMAFNRFSGSGAIMIADIKHPFENIIGYSQVFLLGQKLFSEYVPVSGMYSLLQGAIFDWFGEGGLYSNYNVTNNIFYLLIILLLVFLLKQHISGSKLLLVSIVFYVIDYNRLGFLLPVMLLLTWPKLIEKRNLWLQIWFLTSLFQGLYYPLYGAAACLAFGPLGVWQIISYVRKGELKKDIRKPFFWLSWGCCMILLIICSNCLWGTLKHMLAMSGQSIWADGITGFGRLLPTWFFPQINDFYSLRIILYYIFTFMIPVILVWISFALSLEAADISLVGSKIKIGHIQNMCVTLSMVIMPMVCYTFTFIRLEPERLFSRSRGILYAGVILLLIFSWRFINNKKLQIWLISLLVFIPSIENEAGILRTENDSKLAAYYTVPNGYVYVSNDEVKKLGTGFAEPGFYNSIENEYNRFLNKDRNNSYMGSVLGYYYLLDLKGDGVMEFYTTRGFRAAEEMVDIARKNGSIIGKPGGYEHYYMYHWLVGSGEYIWNVETQEFYPNNGLYTKEEIREQNKRISILPNAVNVGKTASSWGLSMDSLLQIFTKSEYNYIEEFEGNGRAIRFEQPFDGDDSDFIYVEFAGMDQNYVYTQFNVNDEVEQNNKRLAKVLMKKNYNAGMMVQLRWLDENGEECSMNCNMSEGKLLIPVGAGLKWLFNRHDYVSFHTYQDGREIVTPKILNLQFLKLREVS